MLLLRPAKAAPRRSPGSSAAAVPLRQLCERDWTSGGFRNLPEQHSSDAYWSGQPDLVVINVARRALLRCPREAQAVAITAVVFVKRGAQTNESRTARIAENSDDVWAMSQHPLRYRRPTLLR
jgi:hypothetical protein